MSSANSLLVLCQIWTLCRRTSRGRRTCERSAERVQNPTQVIPRTSGKSASRTSHPGASPYAVSGSVLRRVYRPLLGLPYASRAMRPFKRLGCSPAARPGRFPIPASSFRRRCHVPCLPVPSDPLQSGCSTSPADALCVRVAARRRDWSVGRRLLPVRTMRYAHAARWHRAWAPTEVASRLANPARLQVSGQ